MPNPYINRVDIQRGNTTETLINIGDTTAVAADVAQGKYFYLATGEKVAGTSSGGGTGGVAQDANGYLVLSDQGGGSSITVEPLSVTQNGTYTAPTGKAYSPVTVSVSGGGGHKVTISSSNENSNCRVKLNGEGSAYYHDGDEIEFSEGDYLQIYAAGSRDGGTIVVNGVTITASQNAVSYNYALPPCNVAVRTVYSNSGYVYVTTEEPIVLFENGEFTPSEDAAEISVNFAESHMQPPTIVMVGDIQGSTSTTSTVAYFMFIDNVRLFGGSGRFGTSNAAQGLAGGMYNISTSSLTASWTKIVYGSSNTSATDSSYSRWWASTTGFRAYLGNSRYFTAGRKYAWTAIWTS